MGAAEKKIEQSTTAIVVTTEEQLRSLIGDVVRSALDSANKNAPKAVYLTLEQMAQVLQVSTRTVTNWIAKAGMPAIRVGNEWRFDLTVVRPWLAEQKYEVDKSSRPPRAKRLGS